MTELFARTLSFSERRLRVRALECFCFGTAMGLLVVRGARSGGAHINEFGMKADRERSVFQFRL